ncbi:MAG: hypothetical protein A2Z25_22060 [Planctomycetes bacterium RBG_16_55_9]|nr:MAG: hypothetical protein A2Z25_22060 [Planctomycetes bacterium RBG_16_55_9]
MVRIAPISIMLLPLVILLLFALIAFTVLIIKRSSHKFLVVGIMALVLVLFASFFVLRVTGLMVKHHHARASRVLRAPRPEETSAAIWLPGIEDEFEANVYPSKLSAVRSLGLRIGQAVRLVFDEQKSPSRFVLFQGAHERSLIEEFGHAVNRAFPNVQCSIEPETAGVQPDEIGIRLDLTNIQTHPAPWMKESDSVVTNGTVQANVMAADKHASIKADFTEKPWVEDFSAFLNAKPNRQFLVVKSTDSCMTESEANRQTLDGACVQVAEMLSRVSHRRPGVRTPLATRVDTDDILKSDLILDRFVQNFKGSAGKIWRQALLIDTSPAKIEQLAHRKAVTAQAMKKIWVRMFASVFGTLFLITVVYAFLNAATKGYYVWSLRVAGLVLAVVVIILLLA